MEPIPSRRRASRASKPRQRKKELRREKDARMDAACGPLGPVADAGWAGDMSEDRLVPSSAMPNETDTARVHTPRAALLRAGLMCLAVAPTAMAAGMAQAQDTGNACNALNNAPCYAVWQATNQPQAPNKGGTGATGGQAGNVTHGFVTPQTYAPLGPTQYGPLFIGSIGGAGGAGNGDNSLENNGGSGGNGGNGGVVSVTMASGVTVNTSQMVVPSPAVSFPPSAAVSAFSLGGVGGVGALGGHQGSNGIGGDGGLAQLAGVVASGTINSIVPGVMGVYVASTGGNGGDGAGHVSTDDNDDGASAGNGGSAGNVTAELGGTITTMGAAGLVALSVGGSGGVGGQPYTATPVGAQGGNGGNGAAAGSTTVTIDTTAEINTSGTLAPAIWARSLGGAGGDGGKGGGDASGGEAGTGSGAGTVTVTNNSYYLDTNGDSSPAILAQSFGGVGADGGKGGGWGAGGGDGGRGGDGSTITIVSNGSMATDGANAPAIVAQSVGGAGGFGGDGSGFATVGGAGADAANGGTVTITLQSSNHIYTTGERSAGVLAQSVGGGGGNGGNANSTAIGPVNMTIGGDGGKGGDGGDVDATNAGVIVTTGMHSPAMVLQSIGGGGGNGGAAYGKTTGVQLTVADSVGGNGGAGGNAGNIGEVSGSIPTNTGIIGTLGSDSYGLVAQSVGGGGGNGGASAATAKSYGLSEDAPNVALALSIGGQGGAAGDGGTVTLANAGLIATRGAGAAGMVAQSVGGGGGTGGDSSATSTAVGDDSPVNIASSISLGGVGGAGGHGHDVTATNAGVILTTGESADGMLVQSIGGGGGAGGAGDGQSSTSGGDRSISTTINLGGSGGQAGGGGVVTAENNGAILTLGDGAAGMVAQGIGGGGGRGGGGAGSAGGSTYNATVTIGGSGGNGGSLSILNATNNSTIVTFGADAAGIVAQSLGGGGGDGGKAGTSIGTSKSTTDGGNGSSQTPNAITGIQTKFLGDGAGGATAFYAQQANLIALAQQALGVGTSTTLTAVGDPADDLEDLGEQGGDNEDSNKSTSITAAVTIGGSAGTGGDAGEVNVINAVGASIGTTGAGSDAIIAQSVGGGGGKGGTATTATTDGDVQSAVAVGGSGGAGGDGNAVNVTNNGSLATIGGDAIGILAQSIGGGGGEGGISGSKTGALKSLALSVGGTGGANGNAGVVTVSNTGTIETRSHDSIGILAQSIGAGGGVVKTLSTDAADNNGGGAVRVSGDYNIGVTFGGGTSTDSDGGQSAQVYVTNAIGASISTSGQNAFGILAQSIGGGGGATMGGEVATNQNFFGAGTMIGDGHLVQVTQNGTITTQGQGASAIVAQSIGGGGGLAGDFGWTMQNIQFVQGSNHTGNGGPVDVTAGPGSVSQTSGSNAPVVFAQSVGGGGGRVATQQGAASGSAGGSGAGGTVTIDIGNNAVVAASGNSSAGIYAESTGHGGPGAQISINIGSEAQVTGGTGSGSAAAGISVDTGLNNMIDNSGTISSGSGTAIYNRGGVLTVTNEQSGTINGDINLTGDGSGSGSVNNYGRLNLGTTLAAALVSNQGTLDVGGASAAGARTEITGDLTQGSSGRIVIDSDHVAGVSDRLTVDGNAQLAGAIQMRPSRLSPTTVQVLDVKGSLDASQLQSADPLLVHYQLATGGTKAADGSAQQSIFVTPQARFDSTASGLGKNAQTVADNLQANFNAGSGALGVPLAQLANNVQDVVTYKAALTSMGNEVQQAVGTSRLAASHAFVERMNSCPTFDQPQSTDMKERDCAWGRVIDNRTTATGSQHADYSAGTYSVQVGGQRQIADGWFLGGSAAYDNESFNSSSGAGSVEGDGGALGVVLKREIGNWTVSGAADFGYGRYDTARNIAFPGFAAQATGAFNLTEAGLHSRIAYLIPLETWYVKPYLDLHVVHMHSSSYSEQGAGPLGLNVNGNGETVFSAAPMVEVGGRVDLDNGMTMRPYAALGGTFQDKGAWGGTAQFEGAAPGVQGFSTAGSVPRSLANVHVGVNLLVKKSLELRAEYGGQYASGYRSSEGNFRVNYLF